MTTAPKTQGDSRVRETAKTHRNKRRTDLVAEVNFGYGMV